MAWLLVLVLGLLWGQVDGDRVLQPEFEVDGGTKFKEDGHGFVYVPHYVGACNSTRCREPNMLVRLVNDTHGGRLQFWWNSSWWIGAPSWKAQESGIGAHHLIVLMVCLLQSMLESLSSSFAGLISQWVSSAAEALCRTLSESCRSPMFWTISILGVIMVIFAVKQWRGRSVKLVHRSHLGPSRCQRRWRGDLRVKWESRMRLRFVVFLGLYVQANSMDAGQAQDLVTRIMELSAAATTAAQSANSLYQALEGGKGAGGGQKFGEGARLLKPPEVFETDDPVRYSLWREQFMNWLTFCDSRYADLLKNLEAVDTVVPVSELSPDVRELGVKLYSILASYLKGPALQVVRSFASDRHGFGVWHKLKSLYAPRARPRTLAIGQAIMQHPAFPQQKSMLENLLQFDALLDQYELASGAQLPDDLAVSTVLRCLDSATRRHLEMTMDETLVDYPTLKERLILMDKNSKSWSGDHFMKMLQNPSTSSSSNNNANQPTPMEVDMVGYGSKGKQKGKSKHKGKKGNWWGLPLGGGKGKWNSWNNNKGSKGKGKQKGKKGQKGKGKYKSGKGKGDDNTCRICKQPGHWGNECPNRNNVNQVNNGNEDVQPGDSASTARRASNSSMVSGQTSTTAGTSRAGNVRRVKMFHIATPPLVTPEEFDLRSDHGSTDWGSICMVQMLSLPDDGDSSSCVREWSQDPLYKWYLDENHPMDQVPCEVDVDRYHIRAVPLYDPQLVVLDSGADISLLPYEMCNRGRNQRLGRAVLEDAQGSRLQTFGRRSAQVECEDSNSDVVVIEDDFIVASVRAPLISLGRLLHRGWTLNASQAEAGVSLVAPDRQSYIPLHFKRNSLAVYAHIRMVNMVEDVQQQQSGIPSFPLASIEEQDVEDEIPLEHEENLVIQTIVGIKDELADRVFRRGWATTETGNPFCIVPSTTNFLDPGFLFPWSSWPLRTTLYQTGDFKWEVVEHCVPYFTKLSYDNEIVECNGKPTFVLTILHKKEEPLSLFGQVGTERINAGGAAVEAGSTFFREEAPVPPELREGLKPEEIEQSHAGGALLETMDGFEWIFDNKDSLVVNGEVLTSNSSAILLRASCEFLGLSKGGSKAALWNRLNQEVQKQEHQQMFLAANKLYREEQQMKGIIPQRPVRVPTKEEVALHELTHLPFRSWCDVCVACKGRMDPQRQLDAGSEGRRSIPGIQVDYAYGKSDSKEPLATILMAIDTETKMVTAFPVASKGSNLRGQAEHLVRFSLMLNYMSQVEFVGDSEPTMKTLLSNVQLMRQRLGFMTSVTHSQPNEKGRTAQIERAIQTVRRQASTLLNMAEEKCLVRIDSDHALVPWSYMHAAWCLNRFATHSTTKMSPFELVFGRRYAGKVACFGEVVMVLHRRGPNVKQGPQWVPGVWLGKTDVEDMHLVATPSGVLTGKAIRRTSDPWRSVWLFMVVAKPYDSVKRRHAKYTFGAPVTPKPVLERHRGPTDEPRDYDAEDVREYARTHVGSDSEVASRGEIHERDGEDGFQPNKLPRLSGPEEPQPIGQEELPADLEGLVDDSAVEEPETKVARTSPRGSPSSSGLYAPFFAGEGNVAAVTGEVDDERWEDDVYDYMQEETSLDQEPDREQDDLPDEGNPPVLSPEELEQTDVKAGFEEIERLLTMGVLDEPTTTELEEGVLLTTRSVYDWRFRGGGWKRRCRFVAREFRGGDRGNASTFAPTSGIGNRLVMMLHVCFGWCLSFADIKDAFLQVPQVACVLVEKPPWWDPENHVPGQPRYWSLKRVLPGQRNAAAEFFDYLAGTVRSLEFENNELLPSLFRHKTKNLVICSHVDDLILAGEKRELAWLMDELEKKFTMSGGELLPQADQDPNEPVRFLKRRHFFTPQGVVVSPHEKYVDELLKLYQLHGKSSRATPDVPTGDGSGRELDEEEKFKFRSGMGTLLYVSQDRLDIQHAVRHLSQWMSNPTKTAEDGLKRIILYLKGTAAFGLLLPYQVKGNSKLDEVLGRPGGELCEKVEVFTDSDWAGDKSGPSRKRHSVSSAILCVNGRVVHSWSRSQKSIALSSCESEYLAAIGGAAEGLYVKRLWEFMVRKPTLLTLICDSSSCRAFAQRLGVGRLKHIETKYLWLQGIIKRGLLEMEPVPTLVNVSDIGTKALGKKRREFLLFLLNVVNYDEAVGCYVPVGEEEYDNYLQKKAMGRQMKEVRQVMLNTVLDESMEHKPKIPKSLVKTVALLALFPGVRGQALNDEVDKFMVQNFSLFDSIVVYPVFFLVYTLVIFIAGVYVGYWLSKQFYKLKIESVVDWATRHMRRIVPEVPLVDDWDPMSGSMVERRVLKDASDAESDELFYKLVDGELVKRYRPSRRFRSAKNVRDMSPPIITPKSSSQEGGEEEDEGTADMEVDDDGNSSLTRQEVSLPGSPTHTSEDDAEERPTLPLIGLDWYDVEVILQNLPPRQRERAKRVLEVNVFPTHLNIPFLQFRLMDLYPGQPDMLWDHGMFWDSSEKEMYRVFRNIVVDGKYDDCWGSFLERWFIERNWLESQ